MGEDQVLQKIHWKKLETREGQTLDAKFWQVVQNARFCMVLAVGEIPKDGWRSDLDSVRKVMQIDAFNGLVRANSMLSHFWSYGSNLDRFGVVFLFGRCAARTVGGDSHVST